METAEIAKAVAKLFLAFPSQEDPEVREARMRAYIETLSRIPSRFVTEACDYAARGKLNDGRFLPTSAELYQAAEEFCAREFRAKRASVDKTLPYQQTQAQNNPQQRARIIAGFHELVADVRSGKPIEPETVTKDVFSNEF